MIRAGEDSWPSHRRLDLLCGRSRFHHPFPALAKTAPPHPMLPLEFFKIKNVQWSQHRAFDQLLCHDGIDVLFQSILPICAGIQTRIIAALCMLPMTPATLYFTCAQVKVIRRRGTARHLDLGSFVLSSWVDCIFFVRYHQYTLSNNGCSSCWSWEWARVVLEPRHQLDHEFPFCRTCGIRVGHERHHREVGGYAWVWRGLLGSLMNSQYRAYVWIPYPPSAALQRI